MRLLVTEKELKQEYQRKDWLWNTIYERIALKYASLLWIKNPLISFPLTIEIRLGSMKYHYFKYGIGHVKKRIEQYGSIFAQKFQGRDVDLEVNSDEFYIKTVLTDKESIEDQLHKEIIQHIF